MSLSPTLTLKVTGTVPLERWRLGFEGYYIGARLTTQGNEADAYALVGLNLIAPRLAGGIEFSLRVANLLDQAYDDPGGVQHEQSLIPQDGRSVQLRALWHF